MNTMTVANGDQNMWNPLRGTCFNALKVPSDAVRQEAVAVMSRCLSPSTPTGKRTGLVVGYVQSGKTSSFTAVAALARDNHFQLVIVISGSSKALYSQSASRVSSELKAAEPNGWVEIRSENIKPDTVDAHVNQIRRTMDYWAAANIHQSHRKTVLLCVMKNATHLGSLLAVLRRLDLTGVKTLVIDDEADQASLNFSQVAGGETGIYSRLRKLREMLPHVTYLQYTATPQAPLLIRLDDALSPEFCRVLSAGSSFTGPASFGRLLEEISASDIENAQNGAAPRSLHLALAFYFLGVAAHLLNPEESGTMNRTMMVHPSQKTDPHANYRLFVEQTIVWWKRALLNSSSEEFVEMMKTFQKAFDDLSRGIPGVTFNELWEQVPNALNLTGVEIMNAKPTGIKQVNWGDQYHIVIGGQMLDRGFTVEGLTVTFMPRPLGIGTADNIQQRARWFGYKDKYIGYCRVWLPRDSIDAYAAIHDHEENMRDSLRSHAGPLREWRRKFFLDSALMPTRHQVVRLDMAQGMYKGGWFAQKAPSGSEPDPTQRNRDLVNQLLDGLNFEKFGRQEWTDTQRTEIACKVSLDLVNEFLQEFAPEHDADSTRLIGLAMQTAEYAKDNPGSTCSVVKMSSTDGIWTERTRADDGRLHQGPSSNYKTNPDVYQGDQAMKGNGLTLQLFMMRSSDGTLKMVPAIAVYVPKEMGKHWHVQRA